MARKKKIAGITIELDGDATPLKKALGEVDKASEKSEKELSKINRALKFDEGNQTLLAQKFEVLEESIQQTTKRLDALKSAKVEADREFEAGNIDASAYREFIREIEKTESKLKSFKSQADNMKVKVEVQADTGALDKVKTKLKGLVDDGKQAGKEIGQGIAAGAAAGTAALSAMAITGGDVASDLAKMNAVITNLGFDNSGGAFDKILVDSAAVTGEIDSTVEAINNLANTSLDQSQLAQTMEHLTGAAVQFSDTLKLEGLADGLQETLATGEAIGTFGEYLERSGMDLEKFNEGLAQAKARGEEANYVLEVMSKTGAKSFLESYKEMNSELYEYQQAQIEMEIAMSKLTIALAPVLSVIANVVSAIAEWAAANPGLTKVLFVLLGAITAIAGAIALLGPVIAGATTIAGAFGIGLAALLIPIAKVVAAIVGIIAIVALLIKAWEPLKDFFATLWDGIVVAFKGAWDIIKRLFEGALNIFKRPINAIIELMNKFIGGLNNIQIPDWVPKLGGKGLNIPQIPMLAKGTEYFRGGMAIVGEKGPELVEMPTGAKVYPNNETAAMLGGGININVSQLTVREEDDINRIARELYDLYEKKKRGRF